MKRELIKEIEIPEGIHVEIDGSLVKVKGKEGELKREFNFRKLQKEIKDGKMILKDKTATKNDKRNMNTLAAHIRNMIKGVNEKFVYELKIAQSHFPMTVEIHGHEAIVKNFLGEKTPRKVTLPKGAEVKIDGQNITITAVDREIAGQAAANLEKVTKIRLRDRRIFQDGIYITKKAGKAI